MDIIDKIDGILEEKSIVLRMEWKDTLKKFVPLVRDRKLAEQISSKAGLGNKATISEDEIDAFMKAAGKMDITIETIRKK